MKTVCVMMSTYNGEEYVNEQIQSVLAQRDVEVKLIIRDDGSSDNTVEIVSKEINCVKNVNFSKGHNIGYIASFLTLIKDAPESDFYAFCDQDDVWDEDKLISAVEAIEKEPQSEVIPLLYTSALECTDSKLNPTRVQDFSNLKLNFYSEFVRHRFAGCTYVLNRPLYGIVKNCNIESTICPHDTLVSLLVWASGGKTIYDKTPHIKFRRHGQNESVDGMGIKRRIKKELAFLGNNRNYKLNEAKMLIDGYGEVLSPELRDFLENFIKYKTNISIKIKLLRNKNLDCGITLANILFKIGLLLDSI